MTVKDLIGQLQKIQNQEAELNFLINVTNSDTEEYDLEANFDIIGQDIAETENDVYTLDVLLTAKHKRDKSSEFETISELLSEEDNEKTIIEFNKNGMYVFVNDKLRREMDFADNNVDDKHLHYIQKLIYEL